MNRLIRAAAAIAAASLALAAQAQGYPTRPVKIIVPFAPGGFTDVVARILQTQLGAALGQPIVIENKPGAGSTIGTAEVANAKPDGYTLAMVSTTHVITPSIYRKMPYDALKDFAPVMKLGEGPYVLVVHPSLPARNVRELVALARADPGKIDYASSGNGSSQHLVGALFGQMAGVTLNHVPYKGSGQAMQDLVGGQVKVSFVGAPNAVPYIANGKLRALGVTTRTRSADLPDIPTIHEAGVAGYDATLWLGLLAPPGTPADVLARLREGVTKSLSTPEARKLVNSAGVDVALSGPEEFAALMKSELERWGRVVKETGATVN
jgi:tripartite-type tricarboxylate transporter receptor subunit TctC